MTQVILLIGPSGVGKSDYGRFAAQQIPDCQFADLDELVGLQWSMRASEMLPKIGNDRFRERCEQVVRKITREKSTSITLVAVGAGALQSAGSGAWISGHEGSTIAVMAPPEDVFGRGGARNASRTFEQFRETEYSEHRQRLYKKAAHCCDVTGLSLENARPRFVDLVRQIAGKTGGQGPSPE